MAYDEQYETELLKTVENYLDHDGNVAATAQTLFTHRHTIRYRLERAKELCGHDATSTEGREKLGLGLKAMRVLGIAPPVGPAGEPGSAGGKVSRQPDSERGRPARGLERPGPSEAAAPPEVRLALLALARVAADGPAPGRGDGAGSPARWKTCRTGFARRGRGASSCSVRSARSAPAGRGPGWSPSRAARGPAGEPGCSKTRRAERAGSSSRLRRRPTPGDPAPLSPGASGRRAINSTLEFRGVEG